MGLFKKEMDNRNLSHLWPSKGNGFILTSPNIIIDKYCTYTEKNA